MKKVVAFVAVVAVCATLGWAAEEDRAKELDRVQAAQKVLTEIMGTPDKSIPEEIMGEAECISVIPSMLKGGFIVGARYGKGVATCRTGPNRWSAVAPVRIEGGDWGLQIGGEAIDLVMVIMNKQGMQNLLDSKFKIGADASAAAGPVGRHVEGATDLKMRTQVLTYSRSRGAFAGITLNGAVVKQDAEDTLALYGKDVSFRNLLTGKVPPAPGTQPFISQVAKTFRAVNPTEARKSNTGKSSGGATGTATSASTRTQSSTQGSTGNVGSNTSGERSSSGMARESANPDQAQSNIQDSLRNTSGLSSENVDVKVEGDTVKLTGSVPTAKDKATARRIAGENSGGRTVDDSQLVVK